jgi:tyrosinase
LCNSFGGTENDDQGIVEQLPHNPIHVFVGGVGGYLSDNCMSSRDPIFWIHHAQVDRIWESWLNGGGKNNKDIKWLNQSFEFFDEIGTSNMYEVGDVLDIKNQLNYRYDKLIDTGERFKPKVVKFPNILKTAEEIDLDKLRIDRDHRSVVIHLEEPARNLLNYLSKDFNDEIRIKIILHVNIDYIMSGTVFDMYLNLPNNSRPYESTPHYIRPILVLPPGCRKKQSSPRASLPLNVSLCFDVTTNLKQIFKQEANSRGRISNFLNLTFVPNEFCGTYTFNQRADDWINFKTIQFSHYFT